MSKLLYKDCTNLQRVYVYTNILTRKTKTNQQKNNKG
jgi:hypothetical protein